MGRRASGPWGRSARAAGVALALSLAAGPGGCCRPCPPAPGTPRAATPLPVPGPGPRTAGIPRPAQAKFVRIRIVNQTTQWGVRGDASAYRFRFDPDGLPPCEQAVLGPYVPFGVNVGPLAAGETSANVPSALCPAAGGCFQVVVTGAGPAGTVTATASCDQEDLGAVEIVVREAAGGGIEAECLCP